MLGHLPTNFFFSPNNLRHLVTGKFVAAEDYFGAEGEPVSKIIHHHLLFILVTREPAFARINWGAECTAVLAVLLSRNNGPQV